MALWVEHYICGTRKEYVGMSVVEMDERHRVTIPKHIRRTYGMVKHQRFYLVQYGHDLIMKAIPKNADERLDEIIGDFTFNREARRKAEKWLLDQTNKK